eukprot:scaffold5632_cov172-Pinguiococcus_pyrenoidosus.AAC.1
MSPGCKGASLRSAFNRSNTAARRSTRLVCTRPRIFRIILIRCRIDSDVSGCGAVAPHPSSVLYG